MADELGVPVLKPDHPRDPEFQAALRDLRPDCCPVVAYGALLPQSALDIPEHGWVNLHFSCLPAWRGAAPVQHSIWAGDEVTGATTFRIVKEMDAGPTFGVMTERIRDTDTAGDLLARLAEGGAGLLVATLDGIEDGSLEARPQPSEGTSYAPKITVDDAHVDWAEPAAGRGPPDPGLHAGARRLDDVRRHPGQARPGGAHRRAAGAGAAPGREGRGAGRHRHHRGPARRGEGVRRAADARRRLGTRAPAAGRGAVSVPTRPGSGVE